MLPVLIGIIAARVIAGGVKNVIKYAEECGADLRDAVAACASDETVSTERRPQTEQPTRDREMY